MKKGTFVKEWANYRKEGGTMSLKGFTERWNELKEEKESGHTIIRHTTNG